MRNHRKLEKGHQPATSFVRGQPSASRGRASNVSADSIGNQAMQHRLIQAKFKQIAGRTPEVAPDVHSQINTLGSGYPLPESVQTFFAPPSGYNLGNVRVHSDEQDARSAQAIKARAFTVGQDLIFDTGQFSPQTSAGRELLAHELTHTIQQARSRESASLPRISNQAAQRIMLQANVERAPVGLPCVLTTERTGAFDGIVQFGVGSSRLDPADRAAIAAFVQRRTAAGVTGRIRVDGHASIDGPQGRNWRLSCDRALAVRDDLVALGIPLEDIVTLAHGETTEFSSSQAPPNRRATITSMAGGPLPALLGPALLQTPAGATTPLPADTVRTWRSLSSRGDLDGALQAVVWAMEQRGEIDMRLLRTQVAAHPAVCRQLGPILLDPAVNGAFTSTCGCLGTPGNRTPNPRIQIRPDIVTHNPSAPGRPPQTRAELLHSTLIHEFRHVIQEYEKCNGTLTGTSSGVCTDCNSPGEMDSYLTEIEAGYDSSVFRHAWVRVFVNQDFLSTSQRAVFQTRINAAEQRINRTFPGVDWNTDPEVIRFRAFCNGLGPSPPNIGTCTELQRGTRGVPGRGP